MTKRIIERLGETDQLFLSENSAELALERGDLRLQLVALSKNKQEQIHFLHEAIAILEQGRIEFEDISVSLYLDLSLQLAKAYMIYFELSHDTKFALITQQILKPLAHLNDGNIFLFLAYSCACKQENALTRHWLVKYEKTVTFDPILLQQYSAFKPFHAEHWFKTLIQHKLN
ncbi:hypothetical protein [Acinetobacter sp. HY1485]|uniref:hypothetical protein n=1 Tax=Acinetobacter sp. HY1485 TaxID=2970918 RepID=UPI0022B9A5D3|nr:hypothetical protein [Acinetobacter sp. HY1485]